MGSSRLTGFLVQAKVTNRQVAVVMCLQPGHRAAPGGDASRGECSESQSV